MQIIAAFHSQGFCLKFRKQNDIDNYIIPRLGATKLEDLATPLIQHFYNDLLHPKKPGVKPLSATDQMKHVSANRMEAFISFVSC